MSRLPARTGLLRRILACGSQAEHFLEERRRMFEEERAAERKERERLLSMEEEKEAIVQQERRRMLLDHADLQDFLPKGTLKEPAELHMLNQAAAARAAGALPR